MWTGVISAIYFPFSSSTCWLWILAVFPTCVRGRTQDVVLHLLLQILQCWLQMTEADPPQGFPKNAQRKADRWASRKGQRTVRGESSMEEQLSTYLGKVVGKSLLLWPLSSIGGMSSIEVLRAQNVSMIIFSRAASVGLCFYAFLSEFSQGNSSWWAQKCQSESWPSLGLEDFYRKLKRFLGQCLLRVFPLLLLTFSIFFFSFFFFFFSFCLSS